MINEAFLDQLKSGDKNAILSTTPMINSVFQNDLDLLGEAMQVNPEVEQIVLDNAIMGRPDFAAFSAGLAQNTGLQRLSLQNNKAFTTETIQQLADGLRNHRQLSEVSFSSCDLTGEQVGILTEALSTCPNLSRINLDGNPMERRGAEAVAEMMPKLPRLQHLFLKDCKITAEDLQPIAAALPQCQRLVELNCSGKESDELGATILNDGLEKQCTPHLVAALPATPVNNAFLEQNRNSALEAYEHLKECNNDFAQLTAPQLGRIHDMLPAIDACIGSKMAVSEAFESYVDSLPRVDDKPTVTLADLTQPGTDGNTPLSNPHTWQNLPQVLDKLAASGEDLTLELLQQEGRDGTSHLLTALATAPDIVIPALNKHGVHLQGEVLLPQASEQGTFQPSEALQTIIDRQCGHKLFSAENWQGGNPTDLRSVYNLLPENQRDLVSGYHQLSEMVKAQACHHGMGR